MRLEYHTDAAAFEKLTPIWNDLHRRSETATLFNSPTWCEIWWRHFGTPGTLHLMTVRTDGGDLVGVAPMYNTVEDEPRLRFVGGVDVSDYLDVLAAPGYERSVLEALFTGWADSVCSCTIDLHAVPAASPTRDIVLEVASDFDMDVTVDEEDVCPVITLPDSWDEYLQTLDSKDRHELRRKLRKAGQDALITWHTVEHPHQIQADLPTFFELHMASGPDKAEFMTPQMQAFFEEMSVALAEKGWLRLAFLLVNGRPAATDLLFDVGGEILVYNSGFHPTVFEHLSPGWMLHGYLIEHAIALGRHRFDFLRGDENYKFRFGAKPEPIYHLKVARAVREVIA